MIQTICTAKLFCLFGGSQLHAASVFLETRLELSGWGYIRPLKGCVHMFSAGRYSLIL